MFEIPIRADGSGDFRFSIDLDGSVFVFVFKWSVRQQRWHASIFTEEETAILEGIPIFVGWPPFERFKDPRLPKGSIIFMDTSGKDLDPGLEDLGQRVLMIYRTKAEEDAA